MIKGHKGIFKLPEGGYGFRARIDNEYDIRRTRDRYGLPMATVAAAEREKKYAIAHAIEERKAAKEKKEGLKDGTVEDVYNYCVLPESKNKAYQTKRKHESLWINHFSERWGQRDIKSVSAGEINIWLGELIDAEYAYGYVESFLKFWYLLIGAAYRHDYIGTHQYRKMTEDSSTRIKIPAEKPRHDILVYDRAFTTYFDHYFAKTEINTAYLIGKLCGLRIGETFGLKWSNVDFQNRCLHIDRQMQYIEGIITLTKPKTKNAYRDVYMPDMLIEHLREKKQALDNLPPDEIRKRMVKARLLYDIDGKMISASEMVNCRSDGLLQTPNSFKYHARYLASLGLDFRYHALRHTYGSRMANAGVPQHLLLRMMGHGNINVTQQYYLGVNDEGIDILKRKLEEMSDEGRK